MRNGYFHGELTEREKEIEKEIRRQNILEFIGLCIVIPLGVLLFWLYLLATPHQRSAEADMWARDVVGAPSSENGGKNAAAQNHDGRGIGQ